MSQMPEWMRTAKVNNELREAQAQRALQERLNAELKVQSGGPAYWKDLVEKLDSQARFLKEAFGVEGRVETTQPSNGESQCSIYVNAVGVLPRSYLINLFYRPGGCVIRFHPQTGGGGEFGFVFVNEKVSLSVSGNYLPPEDAATWLIRLALANVKPEALR